MNHAEADLREELAARLRFETMPAHRRESGNNCSSWLESEHSAFTHEQNGNFPARFQIGSLSISFLSIICFEI